VKGERLSRAQLAEAQPVRSEGGKAWRAYCPFHGSDKQRSLRVKIDTGHFVCFACGVWGYLEESREQWKPVAVKLHPTVRPEPSGAAGLVEALEGYQKALRGSLGSKYLESRGIAPETAETHGIGYSMPGQWLNSNRDWKLGRLVFPHRNPAGELVNLYGRAVDLDQEAPGGLRHDHLPGAKGYFGAECLRDGQGPVYVCEGAFDALSLLASGCERVIAIFGVHGWRWEWMKSVEALVFAMDTDPTGQTAWRQLGREGCYRGKRVGFLPPESYGGGKDVNEAWVQRKLELP
jgi:DNA primase